MSNGYFRQEFILDEKFIRVDLNFMEMKHLLIEVTSYKDQYRNYVSSGLRTIQIEGITDDKQKISGVFLVISNEANILKIKSIQTKRAGA